MNLSDLRKNRKRYIEQMVKMTDKKLSRNLDIVREQMFFAYKQWNDSALDVLYEKEDQIVTARRIKFDKQFARNQ